MSTPWSSALADPDILLARWRQHVVVLLPSAAPAVLASAVALVLGSGDRSHAGSALVWVLAVFLASRFTWRAVTWWLDWVIVTDRQVLRVSGVLDRQYEVMPLPHVTGMDWHYPVTGRMLGYAHCTLDTAGKEPMGIRYVPNQEENYSMLRRLLAGEEVARLI
ncbi:MAG: PH domain-containing protein [Egibacteraceae bacterium]